MLSFLLLTCINQHSGANTKFCAWEDGYTGSIQKSLVFDTRCLFHGPHVRPTGVSKMSVRKKKKQQQQQQLVFVAQRSHQRKESYNINVRLMWIYMLNAERKECVAWRFER